MIRQQKKTKQKTKPITHPSKLPWILTIKIVLCWISSHIHDNLLQLSVEYVFN